MKNLDRWMVGMDLTAADNPLIAYVAYLAELLHPSQIYFVHQVLPLDIPDEMKKYLPEEEWPTAESVQKKLQEIVKPHFSNTTVSYRVCEKHSGIHLWNKAEELKIDLFLAGSKSKDEGRGILAQKFVRKSSCSVCFVPKDSPHRLHKIMVPVDFSDYAAEALRLAIRLTQPQNERHLVCLHVFELPHAYYYDNFPREQYTELVEQRARREYETFYQKLGASDVPVEAVFRLREYSYIAEHIREEAEIQQADLILMSAGGQSAISHLLLGSEAERIVHMEKNIPVLILK